MNSQFRRFCCATLACLAAQSLLSPAAWSDDRSDWQKGVIEGAFLFNGHVRSKEVKVDVSDQCATLRGYVDSELNRALAEQLALSVKGIDAVINRLVVAPEKWQGDFQPVLDPSTQHRLSNVTITNKVRSQLLANRITSGMEIDVQTQNRVVTLSGVVNTDAEKDLTYWIAKNTQGVTTVVDKLDVMPAAPQALVQVAE